MRDAVRDYIWTRPHDLPRPRAAPASGRRGPRCPWWPPRDVTVIAAAARNLHLLATTDPLPAPLGPEVEFTDEHRGTRWTRALLRPVGPPGPRLLAEDQPGTYGGCSASADTVYHLTVAVGGGLTGHHAQHSGVALANQHAKSIRDLDRLRHALPRHERGGRRARHLRAARSRPGRGAARRRAHRRPRRAGAGARRRTPASSAVLAEVLRAVTDPSRSTPSACRAWPPRRGSCASSASTAPSWASASSRAASASARAPPTG